MVRIKQNISMSAQQIFYQFQFLRVYISEDSGTCIVGLKYIGFVDTLVSEKGACFWVLCVLLWMLRCGRGTSRVGSFSDRRRHGWRFAGERPCARERSLFLSAVCSALDVDVWSWHVARWFVLWPLSTRLAFLRRPGKQRVKGLRICLNYYVSACFLP